MDLVLVFHPAFLRHGTGAAHPERPARLEAVTAGVFESGVEVVEVEAPQVDEPDLVAVHSPSYVEAVRMFCQAGGGALDPDTIVTPESWEAALRAAGAGLSAVSALRGGAGEAALVAVRPPGHHALPNRAMGFCLFNNVAIVARHLTGRGERVAIVDWDVHHGNGTQEIFIADREVLYVSLHQFPFYPGGGWLDEVGYGPGEGATLNFPFPARTAGDVYRVALESVILPVLVQFAPDWLLVSAGFDAHRADPLAELQLVESDYHAMAAALGTVVAPGRTVFFLEGGYDLTAMRRSVAATLRGAAGQPVPDDPDHPVSEQAAWRLLDLARGVVGGHWKLT